MNNTIIVLPTTLYKELIPEEVKNYLIKAKQGCEKSANSHQKVISSGNVQVKVIDKIDLSKFETPKQKAVKSSTKRNVYIIDTNVFVNCPDIISKIDEKYQYGILKYVRKYSPIFLRLFKVSSDNFSGNGSPLAFAEDIACSFKVLA